LGLGFLALAGCAPQANSTVSQAQIPPIKPGMARVWFLRGSISPNQNAQAFAPMIYVNGAPVATISQGTGFYRDLAPGTYKFTVETNGLPTTQASIVQLSPGTQSYLDVDWISSWTQGYTQASWSFAPNTFGILPMTPRLALAYLPTLGYLGER
jgi:hypothetical protein